jgi:hypothetical protein
LARSQGLPPGDLRERRRERLLSAARCRAGGARGHACEAFKPLRSRMDLDDAEIKTDIYAAAAKRNLPLVDV